jgi:hypothetical protein
MEGSLFGPYKRIHLDSSRWMAAGMRILWVGSERTANSTSSAFALVEGRSPAEEVFIKCVKEDEFSEVDSSSWGIHHEFIGVGYAAMLR